MDLGSGSSLGGSLTVLAGGVLTLGGVVILLRHADGSVDVEGSLGDLAVLLLVGASGGGLGDLSLVGHGVLIWDHDVLGTDLGVGSSGLGGELGEGAGSLLSSELSVLVTESISGLGTPGTIAWSALALVNWLASEGDGLGESEESSNDEFHLYLFSC